MKNDILVSMKKETIQFRVSPETKKALEDLAREKNTTVTRLLEHALQSQFPEIAKHLPNL